MPDHPRQIPLFTSEPQTPADLYKGTPFRHTFDLFCQHLRAEDKSEHTVTAFRSDLELVSEFSGYANRPIGDFSTSDLEAFMHWLENGRGVPCSRKSYARRVTTLKVYFKWLHSLGAIAHDPAKTLLQRSGQAPLSDVLTPDQEQAALTAAASLRFRRTDAQDTRPELLLRLLLETGIKKSETMSLTPAHVIRDGRLPVLDVRYEVRNVFKERRIPISAGWVRLLDDYLAQYAPADTIFNCTARNLEYILSDIGKLADLPFKLSFESLRWTCAVRDYRAGMAEDDIRQKLGLSEISWYETGSKVRRLAEWVAGQSGE